MTWSRMPKLSLRPCLRAVDLDLRYLFRDEGRWLAPGQVFVDGFRGDLDPFLGRAAEIERRVRRLNRRKQQLSAFQTDVLAGSR